MRSLEIFTPSNWNKDWPSLGWRGEKIYSFLFTVSTFSEIYTQTHYLPWCIKTCPILEPYLLLDLGKAKGHTQRKHGPTLLPFRWPPFWTLLILSVKPIQEKQFGLHGGHLNKSTLYTHTDESYYDETHVKISPKKWLIILTGRENSSILPN